MNKQIKDYKSSFVFNNYDLAVEFKNLLELQNIKVSNIHIKTNSNKCWYFHLGNKQTAKLGNFIYKGGNLYLNRKYQLFQRQQELHNNSQGG